MTPSKTMRIMGIEEEEVQAKGICNIFNKIITENFPDLEKVLSIQVQEASRTTKDLTKIEFPHSILLKQQAQKEQREITEGCKREKNNI
jgi:hypothetical protein